MAVGLWQSLNFRTMGSTVLSEPVVVPDSVGVVAGASVLAPQAARPKTMTRDRMRARIFFISVPP